MLSFDERYDRDMKVLEIYDLVADKTLRFWTQVLKEWFWFWDTIERAISTKHFINLPIEYVDENNKVVVWYIKSNYIKKIIWNTLYFWHIAKWLLNKWNDWKSEKINLLVQNWQKLDEPLENQSYQNIKMIYSLIFWKEEVKDKE